MERQPQPHRNGRLAAEPLKFADVGGSVFALERAERGRAALHRARSLVRAPCTGRLEFGAAG